jgi:YQGE family putative transporter
LGTQAQAGVKLPWHSLKPQAKRALLCHALYWLAAMMAPVFLNIYLFRLSQSYQKPALYQLFANGVTPLGFMLGAWLARRRGSASAYRSGLISHGFLFALILILRERCVDLVPLLGLCSGLATGIYWQGWSLFLLDLSGNEQRDAMLGSQQWVYFLAQLIATPLSGRFLSHLGGLEAYSYIFLLAALILAAAVWLSMPLETPPVHGAPGLMRLMLARKPEGWTAMGLSAALFGLVSVSPLFLSLLISFESKGNEAGTGDYAFFIACFGMALAWAVARMGKPHNRLSTLWKASSAVALATLPLVFVRNFTTVLIQGMGMAIGTGVFNVPISSTHFKVIESNPRFRARRADALVIRELWINGGRALGYLFIILAVGNIRSGPLSLFFLVIALSPLLNTWIIRRHV